MGNFFQTITRYIKYINPTTMAAVVGLIAAIETLLDIFASEPDGSAKNAKEIG